MTKIQVALELKIVWRRDGCYLHNVVRHKGKLPKLEVKVNGKCDCLEGFRKQRVTHSNSYDITVLIRNHENYFLRKISIYLYSLLFA